MKKKAPSQMGKENSQGSVVAYDITLTKIRLHKLSLLYLIVQGIS